MSRQVPDSSTSIETLQGQPVSLLGLGAHQKMAATCIPAAFTGGINYFFFYNLSYHTLLDELKPLLAQHRQEILVATGSQDRQVSRLRDYFDQVRRRLDTDVVDVFFAEYVSPADDLDQVRTVLDELQTWQQKGLLRYVGATVHNRPLALSLIAEKQCQVLMHRYNMAHRGAEEKVLPTAHQAEIPVVAFTCTRWGTLLKGHPDWQVEAPQAGDCYRYALGHPAVHLALSAPQTLAQLQENLSVLHKPQLSPEAAKHWQAYGDLIYGNGQGVFETEWP